MADGAGGCGHCQDLKRMESPKKRYADLILPIAISATYTYIVPNEAKVGCRVEVTLGRSKHYIGIIYRIHSVAPAKGTPRSVNELIDTEPIVTERQLKLWEWLSQYYMTSLGDVMQAALPIDIRLNRYKAPEIPAVELSLRITDMESLNAEIETLNKAKLQQQALLEYLDLAQVNDANSWKPTPIAICQITKSRALSALVERGILCRTTLAKDQTKKKSNLKEKYNTDEYQEIIKVFSNFNVQLYWQHSDAGRAEIIADLARNEILHGRQVLILTPDSYAAIDLFEQLKSEFSDRAVCFHSETSAHKRAQIYYTQYDVVVGTRQAIFLPFSNLGLVIIDHEEDFGYKNSESTPRYNARDAALVLAQMFGAKTLLISQSPSMESYLNVKSQRWALTEGHSAEVAPIFSVVPRGRELLSTYLRRRITEEVADGKSVVLLQNRRGFSSYVECVDCQKIQMCPRCNVSLTYHKSDNSMLCHYCGFRASFVSCCTHCGSTNLMFQGHGTQRLERTIQQLFPEIEVVRLDSDSMGSVREQRSMVTAMENIDRPRIVIGTQILLRIPRYKNIGLIGVLNIDNLLTAPDFRVTERAFSLLRRLTNRCPNGEIIIQTANQQNAMIGQLENHGYEEYYHAELEQRNMFNYPPYSRLMLFRFRHPDLARLHQAASGFEKLMTPVFGLRLTPPFEPQIDRTHNEFILDFLLKIERSKSVARAKEIAATAVASIRQQFTTVKITIDCDPQ